MRIGPLRHYVTIQNRTESQDDTTGETTWTDGTTVENVPARIRPLSGKELFTAQQVNPQVSHEITLRYETDVTDSIDTKTVITYDSRRFNVGQVINVDERNTQLRLVCIEDV